MTHSCRRDVLATNPMGSVEMCSCGSIHLGVGPVIVRIDPAAFLQLASLVETAAARMAALRPTLHRAMTEDDA